MRIRGIVHRRDLPLRGISETERRRLLRQGRVRRVATWYVTPEAPEDLLPILQRGARATCLTAAEHHGLWTPLHSGAHVYRPRGLSPDQLGEEEVGHGRGLRCWPDTDPVAALPLALDHAARCLSAPEAAILFESALHRRKLSMDAVARCVAGLPRTLRTPFSRLSSRAESGTETAVRWWLESLRVTVVPQVWIPAVGRVDLKLGTNWIIECDSVRYHDNLEQFHRDRARDLRLRALGFVVTRLTWEQVFLEWEATSEHLLTALRRRDHRKKLPR